MRRSRLRPGLRQRHLDTKRAFTEPEARRLFSVVEATHDSDISDLLRFLFETGVRIREAMAAVSWNNVDFTAGTVRVRGTKTRAARLISSSRMCAGQTPYMWAPWDSNPQPAERV